MIKTLLIGHLGKDATVNDVSGKKVINFSVAHTEKYKDQNGVINERTTWVECAWWRDNTSVAQYLTKGTLVFAEGFPTVNTYVNRDNKTVAQMRLRVIDVKLLGSKKENSTNPVTSKSISEDHIQSEDDLPF